MIFTPPQTCSLQAGSHLLWCPWSWGLTDLLKDPQTCPQAPGREAQPTEPQATQTNTSFRNDIYWQHFRPIQRGLWRTCSTARASFWHANLWMRPTDSWLQFCGPRANHNTGTLKWCKDTDIPGSDQKEKKKKLKGKIKMTEIQEYLWSTTLRREHKPRFCMQFILLYIGRILSDEKHESNINTFNPWKKYEGFLATFTARWPQMHAADVYRSAILVPAVSDRGHTGWSAKTPWSPASTESLTPGCNVRYFLPLLISAMYPRKINQHICEIGLASRDKLSLAIVKKKKKHSFPSVTRHTKTRGGLGWWLSTQLIRFRFIDGWQIGQELKGIIISVVLLVLRSMKFCS